MLQNGRMRPDLRHRDAPNAGERRTVRCCSRAVSGKELAGRTLTFAGRSPIAGAATSCEPASVCVEKADYQNGK